MKTPDGQVVALDGKVTLDDNADFRHPDHAGRSRTRPRPTRWRQRAKEKDLNYVKLDGEVGIIGNGAGLVMSTLDVVAYAGERHGGVRPANFLDIGGGASAEVMANGLEIILGDPAVKVGVRQRLRRHHRLRRGRERDRAGVRAAAARGEAPTLPLVVRLDGNNAEEGRRILTEAALPGLEQVDTMDGAAERVAELAAK